MIVDESSPLESITFVLDFEPFPYYFTITIPDGVASPHRGRSLIASGLMLSLALQLKNTLHSKKDIPR